MIQGQPCPECGTILSRLSSIGIQKRVSPCDWGRRCSICSTMESNWPRNITADRVKQTVQRRLDQARPHDSELRTMKCGHSCRQQRSSSSSFLDPSSQMLLLLGQPIGYTSSNTNRHCCNCTGYSSPCTECIPKSVFSNLTSSFTGLPASQARQIADEVLEDLTGQRHTVSERVASDRRTRIASNQRVLYHQTDRPCADSILRSQEMRPGNVGLVGGAIYFAETPEQTADKAIQKGVMLKCTVLLGNIKDIYRKDSNANFINLLNEGYDSVKVLGRPSGIEFAVYKSDQVVKIEECGRCHAVGCQEWHASGRFGPGKHYCKVCKSSDSDHRSRNCPRTRSRGR